jgi:hypothetical protein
MTQDDAIKGKWVRVGPDLNMETSMTYLVSRTDPTLLDLFSSIGLH